MLKLFQINTVINSGSTGRIAEEIGQLVIANGWESYIAFGRNERESRSHKIKIGNAFDIYWHVLMTRLFDRHGLASANATKKLIKQIEQIKPDIIHLHCIHGYYINYKLLFEYLRIAGIPVVWTLHDCWSMTGHCSHFVYVQCDKWQKYCFKCPQNKAYPASFLRDRSRNNFQEKKKSFLSVNTLTLVSVSAWLNNVCAQSFFKDVPNIVIHNGINTEVFKPVSEEKKKECLKKYKINTEYFILGVASVWSERKGLRDFFRLAGLMPDNYHIVLVGLSKKQIKNLPSRITGIKRTESTEELAALYSVADVFVNPTYEDSFPTTNLEAFACGTPVITYKTGGSVESITSETGFVVEQGDVQGILNAIQEITGKGKKYYLTICRNHALDYFRKEDRYLEYLQLYEELISKK